LRFCFRITLFYFPKSHNCIKNSFTIENKIKWTFCFLNKKEELKMKKVVLAVFAALFLAGSAFAGDGTTGEINVKVGVDVAGTFGGDFNGDTETGFSAAAEYLYPVSSKFKVGAGVGYLFPREIDKSDGAKISLVPIYAIAQVNPITEVPEVFFKVNLGYNTFDVTDTDGADKLGGVTFGFGAGYEFPFGLILEAAYSYYTIGLDDASGKVSGNYSKFGLNAGYKFKL
jgi:hypothetical protein